MNAPPPAAVVGGQPLAEMPSSLYVPPDALRILLDSFEGPLDLLHYLIRRNNIDILDIPMAQITRQYLEYVDRVVADRIELAADYLLMSATLIEIKSRMLLPAPESAEGEEPEDPRAELVRRLLEYSRYKGAAAVLADRPRLGRDFLYAAVELPKLPQRRPTLSARELAAALLAARERTKDDAAFSIEADRFTVREAMVHLLLRLRDAGRSMLSRLLGSEHASRSRVGVFFLAIMQMAKERLVSVDQAGRHEVEVKPRSRGGK